MHCDRSSKRNLAMNLAMKEMSRGMSLADARQLMAGLMRRTLPELRDEVRRRREVFQERPKTHQNPEGAYADALDSIRRRLEDIASAIDEGDQVEAKEAVGDALEMVDDVIVELQKE